MGDELRHIKYRLPAAEAFAAANSIDRVVLDGPRRTLGLVTAGKSYLNVVDALRLLGIDEGAAAALGLRLLKIGMVHPVVGSTLRSFAAGHQELLFVEEKTGLLEPQAASLLFNLEAGLRPQILGKRDLEGQPLLAAYGVLDALQIAETIGRRLEALGLADEALRAKLACIAERARSVQTLAPTLTSASPGSAQAVRTTPPPRPRTAASP